MTTAICLWSGPRNVSTALMYSFAQNDLVAVVDEPLYGHYLRTTGADHPGGEDVIAAMNCDGDAVMRELLQRQAAHPEPRLFVKHMAHHLVDIDLGFLRETCNIFLIRDPWDMLPSLSIQLPDPRLADTGLRRQWKLFSDLREAGQQPAVLDSRELLTNPRNVVGALCEHIDLPFHARDAELGGGTAAGRRCLGATLVPCRAPQHRLRTLPRKDGVSGPPSTPARRMSAMVRTTFPARDPRRHQRNRQLMNVDPRNQDILVYVNGELRPRNEARVSVFDSAVQGGDAVWEGLRVYRGRIAAFSAHLARLQNSAKALAFAAVPTSQEVRDAVFETLKANDMRDGAHIRLTLTRGEKITSGMNPRLNQSGCSLIVLAEWKPPVYSDEGIRVITASTRRNTPSCLDSKIHHNNLLNNILAAIEANVAGADSAVMLDLHGFISETNDTNIFMVRSDTVCTPHADACLPGLTRQMVIDICREQNIPVTERNLSLTELYTADEVFTTGTMGELTPVLEADGRVIGNGTVGETTRRLQKLHREVAWRDGEEIPF